MASNIKDRQNRQAVERVLGMLKERLKTTSTKNNTNGLCCVAGLSDDKSEFVHVWEPLVVNRQHLYRCNNKFDTDVLKPLFCPPTCVAGILMVSGDMTYLYQTDLPQCTSMVLKQKVVGLLAKRQSRGGMSQNRIARLATDSRHQYANRIVAILNEHATLYAQVLVVTGSNRETIDRIVDHKELHVTVKEKCRFQADWKQWDTAVDPHTFLKQSQKELRARFQFGSVSQHNTQIQNILTLVQKDPDWLCFGASEISSQTCEFVVSTKEHEQKGDIVVTDSSVWYSAFRPLKRVGKRFFKFVSNVEFDEDEADDFVSL